MSGVTITYLEMLSPEDLKPVPCTEPRFWIREATVKQWEYNQFMYRLVGADWRWTDRHAWTNGQWRDYVESDRLRTFGAYQDGSPAGFYELRQDEQGGMEIAIFGLAPKFVGRGYGGVLLTCALREAWQTKPKRVWLHTCSLDHPAALANYQARGMSVYKTETR